MRSMFARWLAAVVSAVFVSLVVGAPALAQENTTTTTADETTATTTLEDEPTTTTTPEDGGGLIPLPGGATTTTTATTTPGGAVTTIATPGVVDESHVTPAGVIAPSRVSAGHGGTADGGPDHPATATVVLAVALTMAATAFIVRTGMTRG
jgi:hypothetical protein